MRATNNQINLRMHKTPQRMHASVQWTSNGLGAIELSVNKGSSVASDDDEILLEKINDGDL